MFCQTETGSLERGPIVTLFAPILPGHPGKLPFVLVFVAVDAKRKLDLESCIVAGWNMTVGTLNRRVRKGQREARFCMVRHRKCGGAPTLHRVARFTFATIRPIRKLPPMRIRFVAVCARIVRQRSFEVRSLVTLLAWDINVLAEQGELRLRMVERDFGVRLLPRKGCMARVAALCEAALVRVAMAVCASGKRQSCVANLSVRCRSMATLAQNVTMLTCQGIAGLRVIESLFIDDPNLPIFRRVASSALAAQTPLMFIFVACTATR